MALQQKLAFMQEKDNQQTSTNCNPCSSSDFTNKFNLWLLNSTFFQPAEIVGGRNTNSQHA